MEQGGPIANARKNFQQFVQQFEYRPAQTDKEFAYLQSWIYSWLDFGGGTEYTGRNYETYLRVCLDIADAAFRGEINFDYRGTAKNEYKDARPRKIDAIHSPDGSDAAYYADRATYETIVTSLEFDTQRELSDTGSAIAALIEETRLSG